MSHPAPFSHLREEIGSLRRTSPEVLMDQAFAPLRERPKHFVQDTQNLVRWRGQRGWPGGSGWGRRGHRVRRVPPSRVKKLENRLRVPIQVQSRRWRRWRRGPRWARWDPARGHQSVLVGVPPKTTVSHTKNRTVLLSVTPTVTCYCFIVLLLFRLFFVCRVCGGLPSGAESRGLDQNECTKSRYAICFET